MDAVLIMFLIAAGMICIWKLFLEPEKSVKDIFKEIWVRFTGTTTTTTTDTTSAASSEPTPVQDEYELARYTDFEKRVMLPCIKDNWEECGLSRPGTLKKHMAPVDKQVVNHPQFGIVYQYDFNRKSKVSGNIQKGFHFEYLSIEGSEIASKINTNLPTYSICAGYGEAYIVDTVDLPNGRIRLIIGR